jgi:hypothetical protein
MSGQTAGSNLTAPPRFAQALVEHLHRSACEGQLEFLFACRRFLAGLAEGAISGVIARAFDTERQSLCLATTIVLVWTGFFCASRLLMRLSAWPFNHACAMNTARSPKTTANVTITIVDLRATTFPNLAGAFFLCALHRE